MSTLFPRPTSSSTFISSPSPVQGERMVENNQNSMKSMWYDDVNRKEGVEERRKVQGRRDVKREWLTVDSGQE